VEIEYQRPPREGWFPITQDPLANTGRYDWRIPDHLLGPLALRLTVSDKGGNRVVSERQAIEITKPRPTESLGAIDVAPGWTKASVQDDPRTQPSEQARKRARELFREGITFRDRGDHHRGIARMREVVRLDPQMTEAFAELGGMLYLLGDSERALSAYDLALRQRPTMRAALQGSAKVYHRLADFASAARCLRTILRYSPNDAETWMNLGDIGIFQGDEVLARECYLRATQIDPEAKTIVEQARQRLELMAEVSRTYQGER
jgi:tetratricopeptide (TPR) repeat protein